MKSSKVLFFFAWSGFPAIWTLTLCQEYNRQLNELSIYPPTYPTSDDIEYSEHKCRGQKLLGAMYRDEGPASKWVYPIRSAYDGYMFREALWFWGWTETFDKDSWCDMDWRHHLSRAFHDMGIDPRSRGRGGPNECFHVMHRYPMDDPRPVYDQAYYIYGIPWHMTDSYFTIGVNVQDGIVYFINRASPEVTAKRVWGLKESPTFGLPALRRSSDFAWGFWYRVAWGRLHTIRKMMSTRVTNGITERIIQRALKEKGIRGVQKWPGTNFMMGESAGHALLGSPNGRAVGYFLTQHKQELGGNLYVTHVTVFRSDDDDETSMPNLLFWIDDPR